MTECSNFYRATLSIARSLLSCGVRLSVCLSRCMCVKTAKRTIKLFHRLVAHHSSFPKGDPTVKFRRGHPQQGRKIEVGYQKFAIFNQYFIVSLKRCETGTNYYVTLIENHCALSNCYSG